MKTIITTVLLVLVISVGFAGNTNMQEAQKNLKTDIQEVFEKDMSQYNNYLYTNDIRNMREKVVVVFKVNENNVLELLRTKSSNLDASNYVKSVFGSQKIKADAALVGKIFSLDLELKYKAL